MKECSVKDLIVNPGKLCLADYGWLDWRSGQKTPDADHVRAMVLRSPYMRES